MACVMHLIYTCKQLMSVKQCECDQKGLLHFNYLLKQFFINVQVSIWDVEAVMITKKQVKNQMHCCCLFRWVKQRLMGNLNRCVNQCLVKLKLRQWMPLTSLDVSEQEATVTCVPFRQAIPKMMNVYLRWHLPTSPQPSGQPQVSKSPLTLPLLCM